MNLFDFTYCGNYNRHIQNLSRMVPEKWSFGENEDRGILKGYLEHTFQRVYEEGKVLEEDSYAIFNTGLFNYYYQPVYAFFVKNLVPDRQKWFLEGFYTEYYLLKSGIVSLPERAEYVKNPAHMMKQRRCFSYAGFFSYVAGYRIVSIFDFKSFFTITLIGSHLNPIMSSKSTKMAAVCNRRSDWNLCWRNDRLPVGISFRKTRCVYDG